jgi:uncharacterized membrane protein YozB (DUF420 family)/cytochrome oxidase Cu insertion factor (SCO1/SenC/PrrC family)
MKTDHAPIAPYFSAFSAPSAFQMLAVVVFAWASPVLAQQTPPLFTELGPISTFTLTDHNGAPFEPEQLRGKIWIAHFFFTTCTTGCEKTVARMREIQDAARGKNDIALVSISLNPDLEDPKLLAEYAEGMGAEPGQWRFLTGPKTDVYDVVTKRFFQPLAFDPAAPPERQITHTFNLVIVDREGKFAGYIDGQDPANVPLLLERVRGLASQRYVLPAVNATLNATAGFLLVVGYVAIRRRNVGLHKKAMVSALACSGLFLVFYLYYHFVVLRGESPRLVGPGPVRVVYLTILLTHTILAALVAPLAIFVAYQGFTNNLARHVKVARYTLPIWLYVSATGVLVYAMLYHFYPPY